MRSNPSSLERVSSRSRREGFTDGAGHVVRGREGLVVEAAGGRPGLILSRTHGCIITEGYVARCRIVTIGDGRYAVRALQEGSFYRECLYLARGESETPGREWPHLLNKTPGRWGGHTPRWNVMSETVNKSNRTMEQASSRDGAVSP